MRRRAAPRRELTKRALRLALVAFPVVLCLAAACTAFNDAVVTDVVDAGPDGTPRGDAGDAALSDALPDAAAYPTYLSPSDGARMCARIAACPSISEDVQRSIGLLVDPNNFSLCMEWATGPISPLREGILLQRAVLQCIAQAQSCVAAGSCTWYEALQPGDPRCAGPQPDAAADGSTETCIDDGGARIDCLNSFAVHCTEPGQETPGSSCRMGTDGLNWCTTSAPCTGNTICMGTFQDYCTVGLHFRVNCASNGGTCGVDEGGFLICNPPCNALSTSCTGDVAVVCDSFEQSSFDCASIGGTCTAKSNAVHCVRPNDACGPLDPDINVCTGTSISVCVGGKKSSFDCASIGKACVPGTGFPQTPHCG